MGTYFEYLELGRCLNGDKREPNAISVPLAAEWINQELPQRWKSERRLKIGKLEFDPHPSDPSLIPFFCIEDAFCPQIFGFKFGARHILEALAFRAEASFGALSESTPDKFNDLLGLEEYSLLVEFWLRYFGKDRAFSGDALDDD
jgi:hypothetical protein